MDVSFLLTFLCLLSGTGAYRYKYLGCYVDSDGGGRDVQGKDMAFSSLTLETCVNQCQPAGYAYAALQMATRCLCGTSYGRTGYSLFCNCTCDGVYCGGYQSNDIFYSVDNSLTAQRGLVYHNATKSFDDARMVCVANNGDLSVVNTQALIANVVSKIAEGNSATPTNVWFGLHQRLSTYPYEWTNENADPYGEHMRDFDSLWITNDPHLACVSINVAKQKWESKSCAEILPFVCDQMPFVNAPTTSVMEVDTATDAGSSDPAAASNRLALYIVMPLFLLCYGGSCIFYCAYKIYRNCCYKRKAAMRFEPVPGHPPPIEPVRMGPGGPFKRPLSGGPKKSAVYPMNVESLVKTGPYPKYETSGGAMMDAKKELGLMRKPAVIPTSNNGGVMGMVPPPSYFGRGPAGGDGGGPGAAAEDDGYNNMSISEILKKKMMEKNNRGK